MSDNNPDASKFAFNPQDEIAKMMQAVALIPPEGAAISLFNGMVVRVSSFLPENTWLAVDKDGKILAGSIAGREPFLVTEQGWVSFLASEDVGACLQDTINNNGGDLDAAMNQLNEEVHGGRA